MTQECLFTCFHPTTYQSLCTGLTPCVEFSYCVFLCVESNSQSESVYGCYGPEQQEVPHCLYQPQWQLYPQSHRYPQNTWHCEYSLYFTSWKLTCSLSRAARLLSLTKTMMKTKTICEKTSTEIKNKNVSFQLNKKSFFGFYCLWIQAQWIE